MGCYHWEVLFNCNYHKTRRYLNLSTPPNTTSEHIHVYSRIFINHFRRFCAFCYCFLLLLVVYPSFTCDRTLAQVSWQSCLLPVRRPVLPATKTFFQDHNIHRAPNTAMAVTYGGLLHQVLTLSLIPLTAVLVLLTSSVCQSKPTLSFPASLSASFPSLSTYTRRFVERTRSAAVGSGGGGYSGGTGGSGNGADKMKAYR